MLGDSKVKKQSRARANNERQATISVGIPAFNEEKTIQPLLTNILTQQENGLALKEIIVNASGSTDHTAEKVQSITIADPRVKLISGKEREGKATALNSILGKAKGSVIVLIDADVVLEKHAIAELTQPLLVNEKVGISSGNTMPIKRNHKFFHFASFFIRSLHHEECAYLSGNGETPKVNGSFYAIRRGIVDVFPRHVVSDDEYASWQAQKKGYRIIYVPEAMVYTDDPSTFEGFLDWQRRIIVGQMYMKRHFNYRVPTLRVSLAVPGLLKLVKENRRKVLSLLALAALGGLSFLLAYITFLRNEIPYAY
jgi:hyaluronan synthase/N-acetylglucosaminyltransferase